MLCVKQNDILTFFSRRDNSLLEKLKIINHVYQKNFKMPKIKSEKEIYL